MGTFYTAFRVENYPDTKHGADIAHGSVDTGAEFTWVPAERLKALGIAPVKADSFTTADGKIIKRDIGFAVLRLKGRFTVDEVIFAQPGDLTLLGARTLEGLGLTVDARNKRLVAAGPAPAATAIRPWMARKLGIIVPTPRPKPAKKARGGKPVSKQKRVK